MNAINRQTAPSGGQIQRALSAAQQFRAALLADDPTLADDEALVSDMLEAETDAISVLHRVVRVGLDAEAMADALGERISAMKARQERFKRRAEHARGAAWAMLDALSLNKHEAPDFTLSVSQGKPAVVVTGELSDEFVRLKREPDKAKISVWLHAGRKVENATLSNAQPVLTIRTK